ncbi:MAG: undecaprenyl-diphosphate phosphatase [Firmicutes bacterium]|nr:undecaprenyl-diphosphate phosphatase [Bacillota bacterium]
MTYLQAVILGLVQGLAEFLPISSSGHLALLENFFGIRESDMLFLTVMLHFGTLIAVFVVFWKDIWELLQELVLTIKDLCTGMGLKLDERPVRKLGVMIIVACIPTALIGVLFGDIFEGLYSKPIGIAIMLICTAILLILAETFGGGNRTITNLNYRNSIFIGIVQGIAIIPGISRSGSTLFASLLCKLDREFAVKFVFLISIPTILGSLILELPDGIEAGVSGSEWGPVIVGVLVSFLSGLFAVKVMLKVVTNRKLKYFSYYLFVLAAVVIIYSLVK